MAFKTERFFLLGLNPLQAGIGVFITNERRGLSSGNLYLPVFTSGDHQLHH